MYQKVSQGVSFSTLFIIILSYNSVRCDDSKLEDFCNFIQENPIWLSGVMVGGGVEILFDNEKDKSESPCDFRISRQEFCCVGRSDKYTARGRIKQDSKNSDIFWIEFNKSARKNIFFQNPWLLIVPDSNYENSFCIENDFYDQFFDTITSQLYPEEYCIDRIFLRKDYAAISYPNFYNIKDISLPQETAEYLIFGTHPNLKFNMEKFFVCTNYNLK